MIITYKRTAAMEKVGQVWSVEIVAVLNGEEASTTYNLVFINCSSDEAYSLASQWWQKQPFKKVSTRAPRPIGCVFDENFLCHIKREPVDVVQDGDVFTMKDDNADFHS